jgi:starch phosphorylase
LQEVPEHIIAAFEANDDKAYQDRKGHLKRRLIQVIADQSGKLFDPNKIIIVWARRFAEYKRADLIRRDIARFNKLIQNSKHPVQIVWAGKPYPGDTGAISVFNHLVKISKKEPNLAVLTGYELTLSGLLKTGADVWLNTPRRPREASGTSGMTAAMNGAVNLSISDGWIPEFAKHGENSFVLPVVDLSLNHDEQDNQDATNLLNMLEQEVLPLYYDKPEGWMQLVKNSMRDVTPYFDSDRMADEYYKLYTDTPFTPAPPVVVDYNISAV